MQAADLKVGDKFKAGRVFPNLPGTEVEAEVIRQIETTFVVELSVMGVNLGKMMGREKEGAMVWTRA